MWKANTRPGSARTEKVVAVIIYIKDLAVLLWPNYATVLYGFSLHVRTLCLYYVGQYQPGVSISKIGAWKLRSKVIAAFAVVDEHLPSLSGHW